MFNLLFRFKKEYIHKKIVIQNLNIGENKSERYTEEHQNSCSLGQLLFNKGEAVQNRQPNILDKETQFPRNFSSKISRENSEIKRSLEIMVFLSRIWGTELYCTAKIPFSGNSGLFKPPVFTEPIDL